METIKFNDNEYVSKENFIQLEFQLKQAELDLKNLKENNAIFDKMELNFHDQLNIMAIGNVTLNNTYITVRVSTEFLERALRIVKEMNIWGKKESVLLAIGNNSPLCIGDKKDNIFSGVVIAPRIEE